ncbi:MAG TPA: phosphatidate cytidylyltransferase [Anaerolineales bacterium]|nr:phosphatidate cytidylyltransferase [Anaerolineales bacterium]HRF49510.1 phosphatidate cytidylyltransferase [Anaerolineales bacterium]
MLIDRLAMSFVMVPAAVWALALGGPAFTLAIAVTLGLAAREYARFFQANGGRPAGQLLILGVVVLVFNRYFLWVGSEVVLSGLVMIALLWHLVDFERGATGSGTDFVATLGGLLYVGWLGGYAIDLRHHGPDGLWWAAVVFGAVWLADTGAYFAGRAFGRHALAPRLSPKKTWEGLAGGVLLAALAGGAMGALWAMAATPGSLMGWGTGLFLGALGGIAGPAGDLGISMLKRQTGLKDAGHLLAGHGGVLDRIDSWLIGVPIGYFAIVLLEHLL